MSREAIVAWQQLSTSEEIKWENSSLILMIGIFQGEMELIRWLSRGLMISMDVDTVVYG